MKLGNDTTKQLMATVVGYIIAVRKFGYLRFEPFANRFGEENPLYAMGFMREKSQKSKWAAYQRGIFFWQAVTLVLAIMSKIAFILSQRFVFSDFEIVAVYMCSFYVFPVSLFGDFDWLCSYMELLYDDLSPKFPILRRQG